MNLEGLGTLEMTRAMPRVPVSHAKMANWRQNALNLLAAPPGETPESRKSRMGRRELLYANIAASVDFAARNSDGDPETCYWLAQQARAAGENKRSLEFLNKALREDPDNENSLHLKAVIATDEGRHADATGTYEKLVAINSEDVNYRAKYGLSLIETGKDKQGMSELEKIVDQPGLDDRLHALALACAGRHAEAFPVFVKMADSRRASTTAPYDADGLVHLITANHNVGNQDAAVGFYNQLIKLQPGAADPENVDGANLAKCIKVALPETLGKLPEPSPAEPE
jgi:Tfp pilus assembly protein PilF